FEVESDAYRLLADWIAAGAPAPTKDDVRVQRLEVFPSGAVLKPADGLQVIVRAWYSDGHSEDVTRWAKFASTEELVAAVEEAGQVTVKGPGEPAISVLFSTPGALARITSPLPTSPAPRLFADSPRSNYIDDLVLRKLQALRIPPSPPCGD